MLAQGSKRRRRRWITFIGVAVLIIAVFIVKAVLLNDEAHPISTVDAIERYREQGSGKQDASSPNSTSTTLAPESLSLPEPGVYRYATTGSEQIDILGGATHQYPEETTITVVPVGCGVQLQWDALRERHDRWGLCVTDGGIEWQTTGGGEYYHEFFGQPRTEPLSCDRNVLVVPADPRDRGSVQLDCILDKAQWAPSWQVLGTEEVEVGGVLVDTTHVRMTIVDEDRYPERITADWYLAPNGLPVKVDWDKHNTSDSPVGDVHYDETYSLQLLSLEPLR